MTGEATLSNEKNYTVFRFGNHVIRFAAPYSLEHYTEVKEWDNGYLVVMAKYKQNAEPEEEYIDLVPILQNLYFDADKFLEPIKGVKVANADIKQVADAADMIVNGYAFTRCTEGYRVLNLNRPDRAAVFSKDGKVLETSMDDIEVRIAGDYLEKNRKFMED